MVNVIRVARELHNNLRSLKTFILKILSYRYRTINGYCNNLKNPKWGAQLTPYGRLIAPNFDDGEFLFRKNLTSTER